MLWKMIFGPRIDDLNEVVFSNKIEGILRDLLTNEVVLSTGGVNEIKDTIAFVSVCATWSRGREFNKSKHGTEL